MPDEPAPSSEKPLLGNGRRRNWRPEAVQRRDQVRSGRRTKIAALTVLLLALVGAVVGFLLWPTPFQAPYFLSIPITEYSAKRLPVSAFAEQDSNALLGHFPENNRKQAFQSQQRDLLLRELAELKSRKDTSVVVHFRAHAVVRGEEVLVLPGDAQPDHPESCLPFAEFLDALERCPAPHKLLILDIMCAPGDPRLGLLNDELVERVHDQLRARPTKDLFVLCACDRGQHSLISEELQQSVFGYYLHQGLSGWADGYGPSGKHDARISVRELADFVRDRVDRWAVRNRQTRQSPVLYGDGEDFALAVVEKDQPPLENPPDIDLSQEWLTPAWDLRDQWWNDETFRLAPLAFRKLEADLLRAEEQVRGGRDTKRVALSLLAELKSARDHVQKARAQAIPLTPPKPRSLAQARLKIDQDMLGGLRALLDHLDQTPPAEQAQAEKEFFKKIKDRAVCAEFAGVVFELACDEGSLPTKARIIKLASLLKGFSTQPPPLFVETVLLERLANLSVSADKWPVEPARQLLLTVRDEERVTAGNPRALQGFLRSLTEAAKKRRDAEGLFFKGYWEKALPLLTDARGRYQQILGHSEVLKDVLRSYDEAAILLPSMAFSYLDMKDSSAFPTYETWSKAAKSLRSLLNLLNRASEDTPPAMEEIRRVGSELQDRLGALRRPYAFKNWENLVEKTDQAGPSEYLAIEDLLKSPHLPSAERTQLLKAKNRTGERLLMDTLDQDRSAKLRGTGEAEKAANLNDLQSARIFNHNGPEMAARRMVEVLQLAGISGLDPLVKELDALKGQGSKIDESVWQQLEDRLLDIQSNQVPRQFNNEPRLEMQERLALAFSPYQEIDPTTQPTAKRRLQESSAYWRWLSERYDAESLAFAEDQVYQEFYRQAAQDYARLAR